MPHASFREALVDLEVLGKLEAASTIFIKANLCAGSARGPETGANISVDTTIALIERLSAINPSATIGIGDSDSTGLGFANKKFANLGFDRISGFRKRVRLVDLSRTPVRRIDQNIGRLRSFALPELLLDADFIISLSKIKTHNIVGVTGSLKNHFGSLPEMRKDVHHPFLDEVIVRSVQAALVTASTG